MTPFRRLIESVRLLLVVGLASCAPARFPSTLGQANGLSSFVVWTAAGIEPQSSLQGTSVDVVHVRGGDVVRLVPTSAGPVSIGERMRSDSGAAEEWASVTPTDGMILLRATAFTTDIQWPRGAIRFAYVGKGSEPGYHWFELEDRVLRWAAGPIPAPFPDIAPAQRIDTDTFADLDRSLSESIAAASDPKVALDAARAIRRVAALRAVRALRPPSGYPYFFDSTPEARGRNPTRTSDGRTGYEIAPDTPLELAASGPALLHVYVQADLGSERESLDIRVLENGRVRAVTSSTLPPSRLTTNDPLVLSRAQPRTLRRAVVHVPPGRHDYRIEIADARAFVVPLRAVPVVHLEDAHLKSEDVQLDVARRACVPPGAPAICAFALALLAEDHDGARSPSGEMRWAEAMSLSTPTARQVAERISRGGPRDPIVDLEARAALGDRPALEALARFESESADEGTRAAWARSMYRGTTWRVVDTLSEKPTWLSLVVDTHAGPACAATEEDSWPEIGASEAEIPAPTWHGVPVLPLFVASSCEDPTPIELVIDGEHLIANPSAGLVRWHVRVRHAAARVRRVDAGRAHVFAATKALSPCGARFESIRSPRVAAESPSLAFDPSMLAPGVELWLREGTSVAQVELAPHGSPPEEHSLRLIVKGQGAGMVAYDEKGVRWTRAMRAALPFWAVTGVDAHGGPEIAVRAIGRVPEGRPAAVQATVENEPATIDEAELTSLSKELLSRPVAQRGDLYMARALLLAELGAARGAMEDAEAADALGAPEAGQRAVDLVRQHIRHRVMRVAAMPDDVVAYGIEPDFDPAAARCQREHEGLRARFQRAYEEVSEVSRDRRTKGTYDADLAARSVESAQGSPLDPRAPIVMARALAASRWNLRRDLQGSGRSTVVARTAAKEGPIDARGELRPRAIAAEPFAEGTFATVVSGRPAKAAVVLGASGGAAWLDVVCVARSPSKAVTTRCPLEVNLEGTPPMSPEVGEDGRARVPLAAAPRSTRRLELRVAKHPGRWVALVRVVFEREAPGTSHEEGVGWVLLPHLVERRQVLAPGETLALDVRSAGLYRVHAVPLSAEDRMTPEVAVEVDGHARGRPVDGTPLVVPMPAAGRLGVRAVRGRISVTVAERVPNDNDNDEEADDDEDNDESTRPSSTPPPPADVPPAESPIPRWRELALHSPPPLSPFQSSLGTTVASVGFVDGTLHSGTPTTAPDYYGFALVAYRRRIESINLWTTVEMFGRTRIGAPTFGTDGVLYEDLDRLHLRLSGSLGVEAQEIGPSLVESLRVHAFVEYSARLTRDFFVLPRLGYDGVYSSLRNIPATLSYVDSEVFDPYRYQRPSFLFVQSLFWYAPFFDDIFYLRTRGTWNAYGSKVSHAAMRPGAFLVFGNVDLNGYLEALWYAPSDSPSGRSRWEETVGLIAEYDAWWHMGSLCVQPGVAGFAHLHDSGWQINAFVNVFASERRGLRDFSSLELDFPEQRSGGIPWRGSTPGAYQ